MFLVFFFNSIRKYYYKTDHSIAILRFRKSKDYVSGWGASSTSTSFPSCRMKSSMSWRQASSPAVTSRTATSSRSFSSSCSLSATSWTPARRTWNGVTASTWNSCPSSTRPSAMTRREHYSTWLHSLWTRRTRVSWTLQMISRPLLNRHQEVF